MDFVSLTFDEFAALTFDEFAALPFVETSLRSSVAVAKRLALTAEFSPLSSGLDPIAYDITLRPRRTNVAACYLRGDDGDAIEIERGQSVTIRGADASEIYVKGANGDGLTVLGSVRPTPIRSLLG